MWKKGITRKEIGGNWIFPLIVMIVITSPLWAMGIAYAVGTFYFTPESAIEEMWGIDIPDDFSEIYNESEESFHGDGFRYTVYQEGETALPLLHVFAYRADSSVQTFVIDAVKALKVPAEFQPSYDSDYAFWYVRNQETNAKIAILYYPEDGRYIFVSEYI